MIRRRTLLLTAAGGLLVGTAPFGAMPLALAAFSDTATATTTITTGTLTPPTALVADKTCVAVSLLDTAVLLTWTPSTTAWASAQTVVVTGTGGFSFTSPSLAPAVGTLTVDLGLIQVGGSYTASVRATYASWSSPAATASDSTCA